jgi:hypothetical protein
MSTVSSRGTSLLTIVVLPEINKCPIEPQLQALLSLFLNLLRRELSVRSGFMLEGVGLDSSESGILTQSRHSGDKLIRANARVKDGMECRTGDLSRLPVELIAHTEEECTESLDKRIDSSGLRDRLDELVLALVVVGAPVRLTTCKLALSLRNSLTVFGLSHSQVHSNTRYPTMTLVQSSSSVEPGTLPSLAARLTHSVCSRAAIMRLPTTSWTRPTLSSSSAPSASPVGTVISRASFFACSEFRTRWDSRRQANRERYGSNGASGEVGRSRSPDRMMDPADCSMNSPLGSC